MLPKIATHWTKDIYEDAYKRIAARAKYISDEEIAAKCQEVMTEAEGEYNQIADWQNLSDTDQMHKLAGDALAEIAVIWAKVPSAQNK